MSEQAEIIHDYVAVLVSLRSGVTPEKIRRIRALNNAAQQLRIPENLVPFGEITNKVSGFIAATARTALTPGQKKELDVIISTMRKNVAQMISARRQLLRGRKPETGSKKIVGRARRGKR
ncbi:MAG: hypothetical protein Q7K34_04780 [archaeon]|nr:hypothetical protein [archaeon]